MVLIKNGTVCDVIEQKYGEPKPDAPIPTPVPAPTPTESKPESAPKSTPEPTPELKPESEPAPEPDNSEDEKKAVSIAVNYIIDNMTILNAMANDAVAEGKNSFIIKDLPGNELAWSKIVDELQDCNFVNCKVIGNTIEVGVNLAAPADDGNYDFEKDEKPDREPVSEPVPVQDTAAESETEEENIEIITGSEDFIIPDEPPGYTRVKM